MPLSPVAIEHSLAAHGLHLVGGFHPTEEDGLPPLADGQTAGTLLVVGNAGSGIWQHLRTAPEMRGPDPLDRWTRRVVDGIARTHGMDTLYPFGGPPWHPFQRWAQRADPALHPSPLGLLIHPAYGLWWALRAALLLPERIGLPERPAAASPCASCAGRPCLTACPVGAFRPEGYAVADCRAYLHTLSGQPCVVKGCAARRACPVGRSFAYAQPHGQFHMMAFRRG